MKKLLLIGLLFMSALYAQKEDDGGTASKYHRNNKPAETRHRIPGVRGGGGLAPTTWAFAFNYAGTLYGTGYYFYRTDLTYAGTNSMFAYTFNYPSAGFENDTRAIYAFDISSLVGRPPAEIWSSFMFDVREKPSAGNSGLSAFANINLVSNGNTHSLEGLMLFQGGYAANLDIYNAEEFESATPFPNNAAAAAAFAGSNPLIGTESITSNAVLPLDFDVTGAVINDLPLQVPTLGTYGLIAFVMLLISAGVVLSRKKRQA